MEGRVWWSVFLDLLVDNHRFKWVQNLTCQVWSSSIRVRSFLYLDSIHHYLKKARHFKVNYWGLYWIAYQLQFFLLQVEAGSSLQTFFYIWNIASHQIFQIINSMILLWRLLTDCQYFSYWIRRWAISCQMYAILS